ncbi:hypothetical protein [Nonomuraea sp. LPB2021202275-12-8]|uniref:hypothetical protein n=1 Tax=Nonomuraea sp. LPB2021202275-12-8 TaxID=3120159 RepID=UPI00300CEA6A
MIKSLHKMGIKSNHMYVAGICSIGLSFATWFASKNRESAGIDRADRWGIFIGQWAPTFFGMGVALRIEETHRGEEDLQDELRGESKHRSDRIRAGV